MQSLIERIKENFDFMFADYGFSISDKTGENTDWAVVLVADLLRIRFVEDRANMFADISFTDNPDAWYEISSVLSLLNESRGLSDDIQVKNNIASLRAVLRRHLRDLTSFTKKEDFRNAVANIRAL